MLGKPFFLLNTLAIPFPSTFVMTLHVLTAQVRKLSIHITCIRDLQIQFISDRVEDNF